VRSLERGERVYLAMTSRGYAGSMPETATGRLQIRAADVTFLATLAVLLTLVVVVSV
jgi:cobalt/nickel transport system permease protein